VKTFTSRSLRPSISGRAPRNLRREARRVPAGGESVSAGESNDFTSISRPLLADSRLTPDDRNVPGTFGI